MQVYIYKSDKTIGKVVEMDKSQLSDYLMSDEFRELWVEFGNDPNPNKVAPETCFDGEYEYINVMPKK